jgi:hypothetical protein
MILGGRTVAEFVRGNLKDGMLTLELARVFLGIASKKTTRVGSRSSGQLPMEGSLVLYSMDRACLLTQAMALSTFRKRVSES